MYDAKMIAEVMALNVGVMNGMKLKNSDRIADVLRWYALFIRTTRTVIPIPGWRTNAAFCLVIWLYGQDADIVDTYRAELYDLAKAVRASAFSVEDN